MRILVTGAAGFVGSVLCTRLANSGIDVIGIDNFHKHNHHSLLPLINNHYFEFRFADITNPKSYIDIFSEGKIDGIVHLSAIVGFPACKANPELSKMVNINGTQILLELTKIWYDNKIPFLFASTGSVYGKIEETCTEKTLPNPQSLYGIHKLQAEDYVKSYPNTISFRFATAFGVSNSYRVNLLVNDLVTQAVTKGSIAVFEPHARRTFIHVNDMANAFYYALTYPEKMKNNLYNCGSKELNWTKKELAEFIKSKTGCEVFYADFKSDEDKRDYEVSYELIESTGYKTYTSMETGINQLIKATPLLKVENYQ